MPMKCRHQKKNGQPCEADAQSGKNLCVFHDPEKAEAVRRARQAGGRNRAAVLPAQAPDCALESVADVVSLVADTINRARRGQLDPRVANCVGYLSGILLKAIEMATLEKRVFTLESATKHQAPPTSLFDVEGIDFIDSGRDE